MTLRSRARYVHGLGSVTETPAPEHVGLLNGKPRTAHVLALIERNYADRTEYQLRRGVYGTIVMSCSVAAIDRNTRTMTLAQEIAFARSLAS